MPQWSYTTFSVFYTLNLLYQPRFMGRNVSVSIWPMSDVSRVITVGDSGVGKTSLIHRMKTGEFLEDVVSTVAAGVATIDVNVQGSRHALQIWDTAGQELYRSVIPIYFKGAVLAILCFSATDDQSFLHLDGWLEELRDHARAEIEVVLVGTKYDCESKLVEEDRAKAYADQRKMKLFWASAVTGQNVSVILEYVAVQCGEKMKVHTQIAKNTMPIRPIEEKSCC
jgi:small GTP-binding protein